MTPRGFNASQRTALFLQSKGICSLCGIGLNPADWHADHVIPFALGGPTELWNGQALCISCNLSKSMKVDLTNVLPNRINGVPFSLRDWQEDFITDPTCGFVPWATMQLTEPQETKQAYVLNAWPGTGKTKACMTAAAYMLRTGMVNTLVYLVPSDELRRGAAAEADNFNIPLKQAKRDAFFDFNFQKGLVLTYQQLSFPKYQAQLRQYCETRKVLVVADEMHHLEERGGWGEAFERAFKDARLALMTTGTPFRSDGGRIPMVLTETAGSSMEKIVCNFTYGYAEALADGVVREIEFQPWEGSVQWRVTPTEGDQQEYDHGISEDMRATYQDRLAKGEIEKLESDRIRHCMDLPSDQDGDSGYLLKALAEADVMLKGIRQTSHPYAGGLVVCRDCAHADATALLLEKLTGQKPVVIHGGENGSLAGEAKARLTSFQKSLTSQRERWMVTVGMVTEGVDVPHLRVLVYATAVRAPLRWTQIVGRVLRKERDIEMQTAVAYMPREPQLEELMSNMRDAVQSYKHRKEGSKREDIDRPGGVRPKRETEGLGNDAELDGSIFHDKTGTHVAAEEEIKKYRRFQRLGIPPQMVRMVVQSAGDTKEERLQTLTDLMED